MTDEQLNIYMCAIVRLNVKIQNALYVYIGFILLLLVESHFYVSTIQCDILL